MGFNTTIVVLNDAIHDIEGDPLFGKHLAEAIKHGWGNKGATTVPAGNHCNAAAVIEQHHASATAIVAVGGNTGKYITSVGADASPEAILRALADDLGYSLRKKKPK